MGLQRRHDRSYESPESLGCRSERPCRPPFYARATARSPASVHDPIAPPSAPDPLESTAARSHRGADPTDPGHRKSLAPAPPANFSIATGNVVAAAAQRLRPTRRLRNCAATHATRCSTASPRRTPAIALLLVRPKFGHYVNGNSRAESFVKYQAEVPVGVPPTGLAPGVPCTTNCQRLYAASRQNVTNTGVYSRVNANWVLARPRRIHFFWHRQTWLSCTFSGRTAQQKGSKVRRFCGRRSSRRRAA